MNTHLKKLFVLFLLMGMTIALAQAQKTIVLKKLGAKRSYGFSEGERIKFQLKA